MNRYSEYLKYVLRHKWYVFWACLELKVPLRLAILHDISKFSVAEWKPYAIHFFERDGTRRKVRDSSGAYDPTKQESDFLEAWQHHEASNKHHWGYWITFSTNANSCKRMVAIPIPMIYIKEMVADWIGASKAITGKSDPMGWYTKNKDNLILHSTTRALLERFLYQYEDIHI